MSQSLHRTFYWVVIVSSVALCAAGFWVFRGSPISDPGNDQGEQVQNESADGSPQVSHTPPSHGSADKNTDADPAGEGSGENNVGTKQNDGKQTSGDGSDQEPSNLTGPEEDRWANLPVVKKRKTRPDNDGFYTRTRVVRDRDFKYPLVRVEEQWKKQKEEKQRDILVSRTPMVADHVVVKLKEEKKKADLQRELDGLQAQIRDRVGPTDYFLVAFDGTELKKMNKVISSLSAEDKDATEYAEPDYVVHRVNTPNDPRFDELWGMHNTGQTGGTEDADIDAPEGWDVTTEAGDVIVGVIDTGTDYTHPDLSDNMWTNEDEIPDNGEDDDNNGYVDDVHGYDFANEDSDPMDTHDHGTHTAGTIGAVGDNGEGVTGVSWNVQIAALKFLDGGGATSDAIEALNYAIDNGMDLTSNSWGGGGYSQSLKDTITEAGNNGQVFVAAAGNSGVDTDDSPHYPSSYENENVISVAATDHNDDLASFSNYGSNSVDLGAPGVDILSAIRNGSYGQMSGTSMATPHVAGVCSLLYQLAPDMGPVEIKDRVLQTGDAVSSLDGITVTGRRLNAHNAVALSEDPLLVLTNQEFVEDGSDGSSGNGDGIASPGERLSFTFTVKNKGLSDATGVTALLTTDDANLTVQTGEVSVGTIASLEEHTISTSFIVDIPSDYSTPASPNFTLTLTDDTGTTWNEDYSIDIYSVSEVSGVVQSKSTGDPISGASVDLTGGPREAHTTTDSDGQFSLSAVDGTHQLDVSHPDWSPFDPIEITVPPSQTGLVLELGRPSMDLNPSSLSATGVDPASSTTKTVDVGNTGSEDLSYQMTAGADQNGHLWLDSTHNGGPSYNWNDISSSDNRLDSVSGSDDSNEAVSLSFSFPFFGEKFDTIYVDTNGYLTAGSGDTDYSNSDLPNTSAPTNLIAGFWDDLNPSSGGAIYAKDFGDRLLVQWQDVVPYSGSGSATFQILIDDHGRIQYRYDQITMTTTSATVGVQNAGGDDGFAIVYDDDYVQDGKAVKITPPFISSISPDSGTVQPGNSTSVDVTFDGSNVVPGTYSAGLRIQHNDPQSSSPDILPVEIQVDSPSISVDPQSISETVSQGTSETRDVTVANSGDGSLLYEATAGSGNFQWQDSNDSGGPSFEWTDISSSTYRLDTVSGSDDDYESVSLSFSFPYFNDQYSTIYVDTNGYVTLGSGDSDYYNYELPTSSAPGNMIAGFWDDLNPSSGGAIYARDFGDHVIVQWQDVVPYSGSGTATFQIVLHNNGHINYYYDQFSMDTTSATIGLQNADGSEGFSIAYDESYVEDGLATEITSGFLSVSPNSGSVAPGDSSTLSVTLDSSSLSTGTYNGTVSIYHNDPDTTDPVNVDVTMEVVDNQPPAAGDDSVETDEDQSVTVSVLSNDSDPDGDSLSVSGTTSPGSGSVTVNDDDTITYTPNPNTNGSDSFDYTISDGNGGSDTATVAVTVNPVNDAPSASFTYDPSAPDAGETINFSDKSGDIDGSISSWQWDFGDGSTSSDQNPDHTYSSGGTYSVTLTVTDDDGATDTETREISVNALPVASFDFSPTHPHPGDSVDFTDQSTDPDGSISTWSWDFGDGSTSTSQNPSHTYDSTGSYTVTLTVTDVDGAADTTSQTVDVVANAAPTASFTYSPSSPLVGQKIDFADGSSDSDGSISSYSWDFGDGSTSSSQNPSHSYDSEGTYTVTLTVTDGDGATDSTSQTVEVTSNTAPEADFTFSPSFPMVGETVYFSDQSSDPDGSVSSYEWDFGDGTTGSGSSESHSYGSDGSYTVTLTVTDDDGATDSISKTLEVTALKTIFSDSFERSSPGTDWDVSGNGVGDTGTHTASSGSYSLYTAENEVTVTSRVIDLSAYSEGRLTAWIRRGSDNFSEYPESGEDLQVKYLDSAGNWNQVSSYAGGGMDGQIYSLEVSLPADAFHRGFKVRFRQTDGSGNDFDYWHMDEVAVKAASPGTVIGETGRVSVENEGWHTQQLEGSYQDPVVIMKPVSHNGGQPAHIRLRNVTGTSFEFLIEEWRYLDGNHIGETMSYVVVEKGTHQLPDGYQLEAGTIDSGLVFGDGWETVSFDSSFSKTPAVFGQIQTFNGGHPTVTRVRNVGTGDFQMVMQEEEAEGWHTTETLGYVAITRDEGTIGTASTGVARTDNTVTHNWYQVNFSTGYESNPVFLANMQTTDGGNTSSIRYRNLTGTDVEVQIEEEQSNDDETWHTTEVVGYLVMDSGVFIKK